jgi:hypothetical protein
MGHSLMALATDLIMNQHAFMLQTERRAIGHVQCSDKRDRVPGA